MKTQATPARTTQFVQWERGLQAAETPVTRRELLSKLRPLNTAPCSSPGLYVQNSANLPNPPFCGLKVALLLNRGGTEWLWARLTLGLLCLLALYCQARGETFIGPTSETNKLIIATNEAIIVSSFVSDDFTGFQFIKNGTASVLTYRSAFIAARPTLDNATAIAGASELVFTNRCLVSFNRITSTGIQTVLLNPSQIHTINLLEAESVRFFKPLGNFILSGTIQFDFVKGQNSISNASGADMYDSANAEFSGPLGISVHSVAPILFSYVRTDQAQSLQQQGVLQGPTGSFRVAVERSNDLTNWIPSALIDLRDDQRGFYRFRISK